MEHNAREIQARRMTHLGFLGSEYHFMVLYNVMRYSGVQLYSVLWGVTVCQ